MNCRLQILLLLVGGQLAAAQEGCCAVKEVQGEHKIKTQAKKHKIKTQAKKCKVKT